ncbi:MAG TPA: 3'-5' exonuclease [Micromonosporaceae bacterium]|nr:3'-5' exonuclease [Micromonosporaceae bacterium]
MDSALTTEDLWAAVDLLTPLALRCEGDLARFHTEISTGAEVDALDPRAEAVTLLTLHAAKGLEFPVVFLVGCEDGLLPLRLPGGRLAASSAPTPTDTPNPTDTPSSTGTHNRSDTPNQPDTPDSTRTTGAGGEAVAGGDVEAEAEERRLFFVGLTRAQNRLYLSHTARRVRYGKERETRPSPFLAAIDAGLMERLGDNDRRRPRDRQLRLL